jgi:hypothetical protein
VNARVLRAVCVSWLWNIETWYEQSYIRDHSQCQQHGGCVNFWCGSGTDWRIS